MSEFDWKTNMQIAWRILEISEVCLRPDKNNAEMYIYMEQAIIVGLYKGYGQI